MKKNWALKATAIMVFFTTLFIFSVPGSLIEDPKPVMAATNDSPAVASSRLAAGINFALAVDPNGNVWAWGDNSAGQLGQGSTDTTPLATPVQVKGLTDVVAVAAGGLHALALKADGTVWAWGNNEASQIGIDQTSPVTTPTQVPNMTNIVGIAAGMESSIALTSDGQVWQWGTVYKTAGSTQETIITKPEIAFTNLNNVIKIAAGSAWYLALKNDGTVWTWGGQKVALTEIQNSDVVTDVVSLTQVNGISNVVDIAGGYSHSLALKEDGTVWGWGSNETLQLGNLTQPWYDSPVQIPSLKNVSKISAGAYLSMALTNDGSVWTLGGNIYGQLGNGTNPDSLPASADPAQVNIQQATAIAAGFGFALARAGGNNWGWGENSLGQLGIGSVSGSPDDYNSGTTVPTRGKLNLWLDAAPYQQRIAGIKAVNTAVEIAKNGWPNGASTVILATVNNFPDALSAATLAHQFDAPILLTDTKSLDPDVQAEIDTLKPSKIIIVGGKAVVSGDIENSLKQKYSDVTRLAGLDQYETAVKIADYYYSVNPDAPKKVVIANGDNFPDALSISSWAAYNHMPILLTKSKELPAVTSSALEQHSIDDAIIVGGRAVISDDVVKSITSIVSLRWDGKDPNRSLVRYWGMDQYQTSIAIARGLQANTSTLIIATGENFPDALAGSALAARTGSPIILVDKQMSKASVMNFLADNSGQMHQIFLLGGRAVIPDSSYSLISNYLAG